MNRPWWLLAGAVAFVTVASAGPFGIDVAHLPTDGVFEASPAADVVPPVAFPFPPSAELVEAPIADSRFFGTWCLPAPKELCEPRPWPLPGSECVTLEGARIAIEHRTTASGARLRGQGRFTVDGDEGEIGLAGAVLARGLAEIGALIPGLGSYDAAATLSADGLALTTSLLGRSITVRKDACGNQAPQVSFTTQPSTGPIPYGSILTLLDTVQDEDTDFPPERRVYVSDRQGPILGSRTGGVFSTSALAPGLHHLTLYVTDSGGLVGTATGEIIVENHPPATPVIFAPADGETLPVGAPSLLRGTAFDPDTWPFPEQLLGWSVQVAPGGPFVSIGSGSELLYTFAAAADPVTIRLTATDPLGLTATNERTVHVAARPDGNTAPLAWIESPDATVAYGAGPAWAGSSNAGLPMRFVGVAQDQQDGLGALDIRWTASALLSLTGPPDPSPPVPNPAPISGTLAPDITFRAGGPDLFYRVTLQVTDSGGLTHSDSVIVYVIANMIL